MADLDELARQLTTLVTRVAARGGRWAGRVAAVTFVAALVMYLLGLAAMDGPVGDIWPVLGAVIGLAAVGAPLLAAWRLRSVSREANELVSEVRALMSADGAARRVVIDTVENGDPGPDPGAGRAIVARRSLGFDDLRRLTSTTSGLKQLPGAVSAVTTFPGLLTVGILATVAFAFVSLIFLLALAF